MRERAADRPPVPDERVGDQPRRGAEEAVALRQERRALGLDMPDEGADPPVRWDANTNIRWKAPIPGAGSGTPIVWEDRIFLMTAVETDVKRFDFTTIAPFSFCLVDVDLYQPVLVTLRAVFDLMMPGGVIIVDDCDAIDPFVAWQLRGVCRVHR